MSNVTCNSEVDPTHQVVSVKDNLKEAKREHNKFGSQNQLNRLLDVLWERHLNGDLLKGVPGDGIVGWVRVID